MSSAPPSSQHLPHAPDAMPGRTSTALIGETEVPCHKCDLAVEAALANTQVISTLTKAMEKMQSRSAEDLKAQKKYHDSEIANYKSKVRELECANRSKAIDLDFLRKFAQPDGEAKALGLLANWKADIDVGDKKPEIDALKYTIAALEGTINASKANINTLNKTINNQEDLTSDLRETIKDLRKRNDDFKVIYDKHTAAMDDPAAAYEGKKAESQQLKDSHEEDRDASICDQELIDKLQLKVQDQDEIIEKLNLKIEQRDHALALLQHRVQQQNQNIAKLNNKLCGKHEAAAECWK